MRITCAVALWAVCFFAASVSAICRSEPIDLGNYALPKGAVRFNGCTMRHLMPNGFFQASCETSASLIVGNLPEQKIVALSQLRGKRFRAWYDRAFPGTGQLKGDFIKAETLEEISWYLYLGFNMRRLNKKA